MVGIHPNFGTQQCAGTTVNCVGTRCSKSCTIHNGEGRLLTAGGNATIDLNTQFLSLLDMNGDGLPDQVGNAHPFQGTCLGVQVRLNMGTGFQPIPECWKNNELNAPQLIPSNAVHSAVEEVLGRLPNRLGSGASLSAGGHVGGGVTNMNKESSSAHLSGGVSSSSQHEMLLDINGDGLPDYVHVPDDKVINVGLNTGSGFAPIREWNTRGWMDAYLAIQLEEIPGVTVNDDEVIVNANGSTLVLPRDPSVLLSFVESFLADKNIILPANITQPGGPVLPDAITTSYKFHAGVGGGADVAVPNEVWSAIPIPLLATLFAKVQTFNFKFGASGAANINFRDAFMADIDGDGAVEPVRRFFHPLSPSGPRFGLASMSNPAPGANKLSKIKNPLGGEIELAYARTPNSYNMAGSRWVMSQVTLKNGSPDIRVGENDDGSWVGEGRLDGGGRRET